MVRGGSKTISTPTNGNFYNPGSETKTLVLVNDTGLLENPKFTENLWDDGIYEVTEKLTIQAQPHYRLVGAFWPPDLALRFFAKGTGKTAAENYTRTLAIACEESAELKVTLFAHKTLVFPVRWFDVVTVGQIEQQFCRAEQHYRSYLSERYVSFGRKNK